MLSLILTAVSLSAPFRIRISQLLFVFLSSTSSLPIGLIPQSPSSNTVIFYTSRLLPSSVPRIPLILCLIIRWTTPISKTNVWPLTSLPLASTVLILIRPFIAESTFPIPSSTTPFPLFVRLFSTTFITKRTFCVRTFYTFSMSSPLSTFT